MNEPTIVKRIFKRIHDWLKFRRLCSWCNKFMGGNPFANRVTHGICKCCYRKEISEIIKARF